MRLNDFEISAIKSSITSVFGDNLSVILFGSRVDDNQKGGDIDLCIQTDKENAALDKKIEFLVKLKSKIGDQKIDVVFYKNGDSLVEKEALKSGVKL